MIYKIEWKQTAKPRIRSSINVEADSVAEAIAWWQDNWSLDSRREITQIWRQVAVSKPQLHILTDS